MRILTFKKNGVSYIGVKTAEGIFNLDEALDLHPDSQIPKRNYNRLIAGGQKTLNFIERYIQSNPNKEKFFMNEKDLEWGAAVPNPNKIICVGLNYRRHADETNSPYPETPILFSKFPNTLTGHQANISIPKETKKLDYEAELAIVIGKEGKDISEQEALEYVYGYCISNDLSARDLQVKTAQWLLGKTCDDFCPIGPYLVPAEEIKNPQNLTIKTTLNGEIRQSSHTSDMIFSCKEIISYISRHMTLAPGDVILTGTPEGVILGLSEKDQEWLKSGDTITIEIEKLGALTNTFIN